LLHCAFKIIIIRDKLSVHFNGYIITKIIEVSHLMKSQ